MDVRIKDEKRVPVLNLGQGRDYGCKWSNSTGEGLVVETGIKTAEYVFISGLSYALHTHKNVIPL
jgi:hypothetical protein